MLCWDKNGFPIRRTLKGGKVTPQSVTHCTSVSPSEVFECSKVSQWEQNIPCLFFALACVLGYTSSHHMQRRHFRVSRGGLHQPKFWHTQKKRRFQQWLLDVGETQRTVCTVLSCTTIRSHRISWVLLVGCRIFLGQNLRTKTCHLIQ